LDYTEPALCYSSKTKIEKIMPPGKTARRLQHRKCPQIGYLPSRKMNISKKIRGRDRDTLMLAFLS
jgi:hypothetical protein